MRIMSSSGSACHQVPKAPGQPKAPAEPAPIQACFSGSVMTETPRPKPWPIQKGMPMKGISRCSGVRRLEAMRLKVSSRISLTPSSSPRFSIRRAKVR